MTNLRDRFGTLDRVPAPDLWGEATLRAAAARKPAQSLWTRFAMPIAGATIAVVVIAVVLGIAQPWRHLTAAPATTTPAPTASGGPKSLQSEFRTRSSYPPGEYWWELPAALWMHNPSAGTELLITAGPPNPAFNVQPEDSIADYVAGQPGSWNRLPVGEDGVRIEVWSTVIDRTPLTISLKADKKATTADIYAASVIVDSIRTEPSDGPLGFRIVFTLPAGWDSA